MLGHAWGNVIGTHARGTGGGAYGGHLSLSVHMQGARGGGGCMLGHAWGSVGTHARGTAGRGGGQCMLDHAAVKS